jgi:hypothetical protein
VLDSQYQTLLYEFGELKEISQNHWINKKTLSNQLQESKKIGRSTKAGQNQPNVLNLNLNSH